MTSIAELFPKCRKLAYDGRQLLSLQHNASQGGGGAGGGSSELSLVLEELTRQLDCMEELVVRETPAQRAVWKGKIAELRQECNHLQQQAATAQYNRQFHHQQSNYQSEREELLLRRRRRRDMASGTEEQDLQNLTDESKSYQQSDTMVVDLLAHGQASLQSLTEQRARLRGITGLVFDIGNRLGLAQSTMRIIERRDITDAYLVAAGMVVTCLVFYFVWF